MLAVRSGDKRSRETALGYYMVAASIGQGLGPFVVGWLGGAAALPPTGLLFTIGLVVAGASVIVAGLIRPAAVKADQHDAGDLIPIGRLLALRGFAAVMVSSVVTITALDLLVIYLPALGAERHIDSNHIGLLLTVRSRRARRLRHRGRAAHQGCAGDLRAGAVRFDGRARRLARPR